MTRLYELLAERKELQERADALLQKTAELHLKSEAEHKRKMAEIRNKQKEGQS